MKYECLQNSDLNQLKAKLDDLMNENAIFRGVCNRDQLLPKIIRYGIDNSTKEIKILNRNSDACVLCDTK